MILNKYLKILSFDEYYDIKMNDDSIACIYLVDNKTPKSYIWTIEDNKKGLQPVKNKDNKYSQTLIEALIKAPRMIIDDKLFDLIMKANVTLLNQVNKKDFLQFLGLYEWVI